MKAIIKSYKRPENCEQLYVPRINPEIWANLTKNSQKNDIKIAHLQDSLQAGISCLMIALDDMLQSDAQNKKPNLQKLATKLIDATALMGHVSKELSFKR